jgi:hypothetical protein
MQLLSNPDLTRLCWGDPKGPNISVGTRLDRGVPPVRTAEEAVNLLTSTSMNWHWEQRAGWTVASGITKNGAYLISFQCTKPERALAELRAIEAQEGGLPYKLVLPVVATIKTRAQENSAVHNYHYFVEGNDRSWPGPALTPTELRATVTALLAEIPRTPETSPTISTCPLPGSAVNLALVWQAACARLWEPDMLRRLAAREPAHYRAQNIFMQCMAITHIWATQPDSITVAGLPLRVSPTTDHLYTWWQLIEFTAGAIPPEALRYLCELRLPVGLPTLPLARPPATLPTAHQTAFLHGYDMFPFADSPLASDLAASLCRALLAELAERGESYVPTGGCRIQLPENGLLNAWGIRELRVWLTSEGLWCALPAADHWPGVVFEWRPGRPLRRWVVSDAVAPALEIVLTALWRDLRVEGDTVVPARHHRPPAALPAPELAHRLKTRDLPRKRYFSLSGERTWGTVEERERIHRAAHAVAGHRRRLLPGARASAAALQRAAEYAFLVPEGYTFVRPHIAGLEGEEADQAAPQGPVVRARGLATVAAWLRA